MKLAGSRWSRAYQRARMEGVVPLHEAGREAFRVQSTSHNTWYVVQRESGGNFSCTCPAGAHGQPCKHVASVYLMGRRLAESWQWEAPWVGGTVPGSHGVPEEVPGAHETQGAHEDDYGVWHPHD